MLNHVRSDVGSRHYDRYDRAVEMRAALNRWSFAIAAILDPAAVPIVDLADARNRVRG